MSNIGEMSQHTIQYERECIMTVNVLPAVAIGMTVILAGSVGMVLIIHFFFRR